MSFIGKVEGQNLILPAVEFTVGTVKEDAFKFEFDSAWNGFIKRVYFYRHLSDCQECEFEETFVVLDDTNCCKLPGSISAFPGYFWVGVIGVKQGENGEVLERISTDVVTCIMIGGAYKQNGGIKAADLPDFISVINTKLASADFGNNNALTGYTETITSYTKANLAHGENLKVGTLCFDILGYEGKQGTEGKYKVTGTAELAKAISSLIITDKETNKVTQPMYCLSFGGHWDYRDVITQALYDENEACIYLSVSKLFTNHGTLDTYLGQKDDYADDGTLIICGHPELGTKKINTKACAFGNNNTVQAEGGFASGKNHKVVGNYGATFGRDNVSGYATFTSGGKNDLGNAQYSNGLGFDNKTEPDNAEGIVKNVNLVGTGLILKYSWQTVLGNYNANKKDTLFEVGIGTSNEDRKNGFEVYRDGTVKVLGDIELANKDYVDKQIGDIDTALDELHAYAQALIAGGAK